MMKRAPFGCLLISLLCQPLVAQPLQYEVIMPEGYSGGRFHGADVFENREPWQSFDPEMMPEVLPSAPAPIPEPVVIMYSPSIVEPVVQEVMNIPEVQVPLTGEDKIFAEIRDDIREQQCFALGLQRDCDPDVGFTGEITLETETGRQVSPELLSPGNFYRRLELLEEEPDIEERFRLLNESFLPDLSPLFEN